ncbi:hypothetical protein QTP88_015646 [Uroleucon formosanum]
MSSINTLVSVFVSISFIFTTVSSKDCDAISNFFIKNNLMFLNSTESVVFLPSDFEYKIENWKDFDSDHNEYHNSITYNEELMNSLSETDLSISDDELTGAVYSSLVNNEKLHDLVSIFSNRYVVRTERSTKVFTIDYAQFYYIENTKCDKFQVQYTKSVIKGLICKISFVTGLRYNVKCGSIVLELLPLDKNGQLEYEIRCT